MAILFLVLRRLSVKSLSIVSLAPLIYIALIIKFRFRSEDKAYTAFESCGVLYQFTRVPFGVTNGVACFQRIIDSFIRAKGLSGTFSYLDNVTICGKTKAEHEQNLERFRKTAETMNVVYNEEKCVFSRTKLRILSYFVENGEMRPDFERLRPLRQLPVPRDMKAFRRCLGLFV